MTTSDGHNRPNKGLSQGEVYKHTSSCLQLQLKTSRGINTRIILR